MSYAAVVVVPAYRSYPELIAAGEFARSEIQPDRGYIDSDDFSRHLDTLEGDDEKAIAERGKRSSIS